MDQLTNKESMEFLEGVRVLGIAVKKALADGKLTLADLPHLLSLLEQIGTLTAAVKGVDQIGKEAKDYDSEELQQIGAKVIAIIAEIKAVKAV